jgi:hypothetical protein
MCLPNLPSNMAVSCIESLNPGIMFITVLVTINDLDEKKVEKLQPA